MDELMSIWPQLTKPQQGALLNVAQAFLWADPKGPEQWLTVKQASKEYGIPERTVYDAINDGRLEAKVSNGLHRGRRISRSEMERWTGMRTH